MAKHQHYDYKQSVIEPIFLEDQLVPGTLEHAIHFLVENEPKIGSTGKEIQSNVTDNESAKMATSHGVLQGYNANAMVDDKNQIITSARVFGSGTDTKAMAPMLEEARNNLEAAGIEEPLEGKTVSADTGYYSIENLF